jgi:hypothetical protein
MGIKSWIFLEDGKPAFLHPPPSQTGWLVGITPAQHVGRTVDQVIQDLVNTGILRSESRIVNAFRLFLVSKPDGNARPVYDLSPWTSSYTRPPIRLYSAAEVLHTIPQGATMIKIDLKSGFFQLKIQPRFQPFYGGYYQRHRYAWTRLPMGHPLAPAIMQQFSIAIARHLHREFQTTMVAYLDDWLFFSTTKIPVPAITNAIQRLGITINMKKSVLIPTTSLVYLGLQNTVHRTITPTETCVRHLLDLASVVPVASQMDLQRIAGYIVWLAYAMGWPMFLATLIHNKNTFWIRRFQAAGLLRRPRSLFQRLTSKQIYTDATPTSIAAVCMGPPRTALVQRFTSPRSIAWAEMAAALKGLIWCATSQVDQPTTLTLYTDLRLSIILL